MTANPHWKRLQQQLGQSSLAVFKNIDPTLDSLDIKDQSFVEWSRSSEMPKRYPAAIAVDYAGQLEGTLWLVFSNNLIDQVAQAFLGNSLADLGGLNDDCIDALSEVANQITGELNIQLRKTYGEDIQVQPPKSGNLTNILKSVNSAYLESAARVVTVALDQEQGKILTVLPDDHLLQSLLPREAEPQDAIPADSPVPEPRGARGESAPASAAEPRRDDGQNIDLIMDINLDVTMRVGTRLMPLKDIMALSSGAVIELNKSISEPIEVLVNKKRIAYGEVVVVEGNYGVRITHIVNRMDRIRSLGE